MKTLPKALAALGLALSVGLVPATGAFAKAHDQGQTAQPGSNVGTQTVGPAQGLGSALGNGRSAGEASGGASDAGGNASDAGTD